MMTSCFKLTKGSWPSRKSRKMGSNKMKMTESWLLKEECLLKKKSKKD